MRCFGNKFSKHKELCKERRLRQPVFREYIPELKKLQNLWFKIFPSVIHFHNPTLIDESKENCSVWLIKQGLKVARVGDNGGKFTR